MKYRFSLYLKFLVGYLIFAGISIWFVNYYAAGLITDRLVAQKAAEMYKQAKTITSYYHNNSTGESQEENLEDILKMLRVYNAATNASLYLINARGDLVLSSAWTELPDPKSDEPLTHTDFDAARFDQGYYLRGDMLSDLTGEKDSITVYSSLTGSYHITGYIVMSMPMSVVLPESYYLQRIVYTTVAIVILLSLIILAVFTVVVFMPLKKITNAANEYADGNFSYRATVKSHDEMGYLAATLGYM
ncbi:MAG: HAMP domain-containing protein, partial [Lachnospiraceae bacterium]|nr:HAMP domain-containing protein [Lachnospiraceae bacterium]